MALGIVLIIICRARSFLRSNDGPKSDEATVDTGRNPRICLIAFDSVTVSIYVPSNNDIVSHGQTHKTMAMRSDSLWVV
jgi:hypothetical protein